MPATISVNFATQSEVLANANPSSSKSINAKVLSDVLGRYVTIAGAQTITGGKTFSGGLSARESVFNRSVKVGVGPNGYVRLKDGTATKPGYIAWFTPDNVRRGYVGWESNPVFTDEENIQFKLENGWGLLINSQSKPVVIRGDLNVTGDINVTGDNNIIPAGAVMAFARSTAPAGWLLANGDLIPEGSGLVQMQNISFDPAPIRRAVVGTFRLAGEPNTVRRLPNLNGVFVRGSGEQRITHNVDGYSFTNVHIAVHGKTQHDQFRRHTHAINTTNSATQTNKDGTANPDADPARGLFTGGMNDRGGAFKGPELVLHDSTVPSVRTGNELPKPSLTIQYTGGPSQNVTNGTAGETRPANVALLYCIKY